MFVFMIIGLAFLEISAIVTASFTINKFCKKQLSKKTFLVFIFFVVIMSIYGIALIWYKPFLQYSALHLISVAFFIYLGFILLYAKKHKALIMWCFFVFYLGINLIKISYLWIYGYSFYAILPLHICSLSSVFMIARPFYTKGKSPFLKKLASILDNYLICFAFLGALLNVFLPPAHGFGMEYSFFSLQTFESNLIHWSFFVISIYYLFSGEIIPNKKMAVMNFIWIVPAYIVFIFLNSVLAHNFFYTNSNANPIIFLYNLFPMWEWKLGGIVVEINPIYWLVIMCVAVLTLFLITLFFEFISKTFVIKNKNGNDRRKN